MRSSSRLDWPSVETMSTDNACCMVFRFADGRVRELTEYRVLVAPQPD